MQLRRALQPAVTSITSVTPRSRPILIPVFVLTFASVLAFAVPQASAQINCELQEKGFWRNYPSDWPVTSLQLGAPHIQSSNC